MIYRLLAKFNDDFGLLVFVVYLGLFLVAFVSVFIFPPLALIIVITGLLGFVGVWAVVMLMRGLERSMARRAIQQGGCPCCQGSLLATDIVDPDGGLYQQCEGCSQAFEQSGRRAQDEDLYEEDEVGVSAL